MSTVSISRADDPVHEPSPPASAQQPATAARHRDALLASIAGAVAVVVMARDIGRGPLWLDDAWVGLVDKIGWSDILVVGQTAPGFNALVKVWFAVVGFSEVRALLPIYVAAIVTPIVTYRILRSRVAPVAAFGAALLMALSPALGQYSDALKQYAFEPLLGLLIVRAALDALTQPGPRSVRRLSLLSAFAIAFSFVLVVVSATSLGIVFVATAGTARRHRRAPTATALGAVRPLTWMALPAVIAVGGYVVTIRQRVDATLVDYWREFYVVTDAGRRRVISSTVHLLDRFADSVTAMPTLGVLCGAGLLLLLIVRRPVIALVTLAPLALTVALSAVETMPLGGGRTDLHLLGPTVMAVAFAADSAWRLLSQTTAKVPSRRATVRGGAVVVAVCVLLASVPPLQPVAYPIEDLPAVVDDLERGRSGDDVVLVFSMAVWALALYSDLDFDVVADRAPYRVTFTDRRVFTQVLRDPVASTAATDAAAASGSRIWLIGSHLDTNWDETIARLTLVHGRPILERFEAANAELVLFDTDD